MYNNLPQQTPAYYPYMPQYQRFFQQEAPNLNQTPPTMQNSLMQNYIKGRPVVSIDEARASQIDLDGSLYVFPDLGNKRIYTKQINLDGTASFNVFELKVEPVAEVTTEGARDLGYVTRDELNVILDQFKASLDATPAKPKQTFNL